MFEIKHLAPTRRWPGACVIDGSDGLRMSNSKRHVGAMVGGLVAYLRANPAACDGVDGIARWWFNPENDVDPEALDMALQYLLNLGVMETLTIGDRTCYRRVGDNAAFDAAEQAVRQQGNGLC